MRSKTVSCSHFGEDSRTPTLSMIVLEAWMLWRSASQGWKDRKDSRRRWHAAALHQLKERIADLNIAGGGTGHAEADANILLWAPAAIS
jgi:hypothetical protein